MTLVDDLQLMLGLAQELWRGDPRDVQCTYGRLAWWSSNIPHGESESRLWFDGDQFVGWGWVTAGTELEFQVRPTHREVLDEILRWAGPDELLVQSHDTDAIARIEAHGLVHMPNAPWMRLNARPLDDLPDPVLPGGYALRRSAPIRIIRGEGSGERSTSSPCTVSVRRARPSGSSNAGAMPPIPCPRSSTSRSASARSRASWPTCA